MASVGTHIKRLRGAKRMTQEELAAQLHVTRQAVSAWETGKALPDVETLERIAAALGTDVTEVIHGAKSAPDLTALKRKWVRQGIGWRLWLAIGYYILFCMGQLDTGAFLSVFCPVEGNAGDGLYERLSGFPVLPYRQNCRPYHHGEGGTAYCRADWEQCSGQR